MSKSKKLKRYVEIAGKRIKLPEYEEDFKWVELDIDDLRKIDIPSFPRQIVVVVNSEDGFGTEVFNTVEVYAAEKGIDIEFQCNINNKYWEGVFGLSTFIKALRDQLTYCNNYDIIDFDIDDVFKILNVDRNIQSGGSIYEAVLDVATDLKRIVTNAEISLCKQCSDYCQNEQGVN
jgi:hypothetical protein